MPTTREMQPQIPLTRVDADLMSTKPDPPRDYAAWHKRVIGGDPPSMVEKGGIQGRAWEFTPNGKLSYDGAKMLVGALKALDAKSGKKTLLEVSSGQRPARFSSESAPSDIMEQTAMMMGASKVTVKAANGASQEWERKAGFALAQMIADPKIGESQSKGAQDRRYERLLAAVGTK